MHSCTEATQAGKHTEPSQGAWSPKQADASFPKLSSVFKKHANEYLKSGLRSDLEKSTINDITRCRTMLLGGYIERCPTCGNVELRYNSCSNRNCPTCQWLRQVQWSRRQVLDFLPVAHHQVVLTLPPNLRGLARANKKIVYGLMLKLASESVQKLVKKKYGVTVGQIAALHTWNRELGNHPHVHLVISCGGLSYDGKSWVSIPRDFLVSVEDLRATFRKGMVKALREAYRKGKPELKLPAHMKLPSYFEQVLKHSSKELWIGHIEAPIGVSRPVVKYLARYINRIGIGNSRLRSFENGQVTFETRNGQTLTLPGVQFIERYMEHIVPTGFHRVRHYGLYSPKARKFDLERARALVPMNERMKFEQGPEGEAEGNEPWEDMMKKLTGRDPRCCPECGGLLEKEAFGKARFGIRRRIMAAAARSADASVVMNTT
jgi:hypothetical protein